MPWPHKMKKIMVRKVSGYCNVVVKIYLTVDSDEFRAEYFCWIRWRNRQLYQEIIYNSQESLDNGVFFDAKVQPFLNSNKYFWKKLARKFY